MVKRTAVMLQESLVRIGWHLKTKQNTELHENPFLCKRKGCLVLLVAGGAQLMSPLTPNGSLGLLLGGSTGNKNQK